MWNYSWYYSVRWTIVVVLLHTSGPVKGKNDKSRNIPANSQNKRTQTEHLDSLRTRAIQDTDFALKDTLSEGQLYQDTPQQQLPQSFGNTLPGGLNRQRNINGNTLHRIVNDKVGGGESSGNGGRTRTSFPENTRQYPQQRSREESCCIRRPHVIHVGYDALGKDTLLDVGKCRRVAKSVVAHLSLLGSNPDNRQELLELIANSQTQCTSCGSRDSCSASQSRVERLNLHGGLKQVPVIEECLCTPKPSSCQRIPQYQVFFPGSPYETKVDVGLCLGHCKSQDGSQTHCRPTRNRTVTVEGPMGHHCVDTIESCECTPECYRASYIESYYAMEWNETLNGTQEVVKDIDVGRCAGGCGSSRSVKCLMGSGQTPGTCLMGLYGQTSCSPRSYTNHEFIQRDGKRIAVLSIDTCRCQ